MATFSTLLTEHPSPYEAVGHAAGHLFEALDGRPPDVVMVFATPHHAASFLAICSTLTRLLEPGTLVGAVADGVLGGAREVESGPALVVWGGDGIGRVDPIRIALHSPEHLGRALQGRASVVLADRSTAPPEALMRSLTGTSTVGGYVSAGSPRDSAVTTGHGLFVIDGDSFTGGGVGLSFPAEILQAPVSSQGGHPLGPPLAVTAAEGSLVIELAGKRALDKLREQQAAASPDLRRIAGSGMLIGIVEREHAGAVNQQDVVIRPVRSASASTGALVLGEAVPVGATVQFFVRDAATSSDQLHESVLGTEAAAALLLCDVERGMRLFSAPNHDASAVSNALDTPDVAGVFCHGVFGPVGARHHLLDRAAVVVPFR